jgi:TorA maturation chaperone TorD
VSRFPASVGPQLEAAVEWRLLALLFSRPRGGWREELSALAGEARDEALRAAVAATAGASEGEYHALLGPGGPSSPREVAHGGFADPGRTLADLSARYQAFGFGPRSEEPGDHLSVECDFVSYLLLKEAFAMAGGQLGAAEVTREERQRFLAEHLAIVGRRFAEKLPAAAPEHLRRAAGVLAARLPALPAPSTHRFEADPLAGGCPMAGELGDSS